MSRKADGSGRKAGREESGDTAGVTTTATKRRAPGFGGMRQRATLRRKRRVLKTSELVARDIILDIAEGGLTAGDSLPPEAAMLQHYEVGRASLREALRLLEVHGLVRIRAGAKGGPIVGKASAENLGQMLTLYFGLAGATYDDLMHVLLILYPMVADLPARRKLVKAEADALRASVNRGCSLPDHRLNASETLNDFHSLLAELSGNSIWALITNAVEMIFYDHIISSMDSSGFHQQSAEDHKEIADAILKRDPEAASRLMLEHTERMIKYYRAQNPAQFAQIIEWR